MHFDEKPKYFDNVGPTQISSTIFTYLRYISKQSKELLKTKSLSLVSYGQRTGSFCTYIVCQAGEVLHHTAEDAQTSSQPIPSDLCSLLGNDCWRELSWISNQNQAISTTSDNRNQACWLCRLCSFINHTEMKASTIQNRICPE
jgi:hypothetical protein